MNQACKPSKRLNDFSSNSSSCSRNSWRTCAQHPGFTPDNFPDSARYCRGQHRTSPATAGWQGLLLPVFVSIVASCDPRRLALSARRVARRQCERHSWGWALGCCCQHVLDRHLMGGVLLSFVFSIDCTLEIKLFNFQTRWPMMTQAIKPVDPDTAPRVYPGQFPGFSTVLQGSAQNVTSHCEASGSTATGFCQHCGKLRSSSVGIFCASRV